MELTKKTAEATATMNHTYANEAGKALKEVPQSMRDVKTAQLSLIEELSLDHAKEFGRSGPTRKFIGPPSLPFALVLLALLSGPQPLEQLQLLAGVYDCDALVATLRNLGLEVPCHQIPEMDANDQVSCRTVCALTKADTRHVNRWIKNSKAESLSVYTKLEHSPRGNY